MALLVAFFAALGCVIGFQDSIPWPLETLAYIYLGGLWMSLGHELLHGHPTPWNSVNTAIGFIPLSFWVPFLRYKAMHIKHHRSDLTFPEDDPESFYVAPMLWNRAGIVRRSYFLFLRTVPGRLTIGVVRGIIRFWRREIRLAPQGGLAKPWLVHIAASIAFGWLLFGVLNVSPWTYIFGFCLGGAACTQLRSFLEHAAVPEGTRSAVVKAGPVMSLLFLNNNLHHTHHALEDLAWYRIPAMHREIGADELAARGAGLYPGGYLEVCRTYFFRPFCQPDHPLSAEARPYGARGLR
ncbi:MAG: fatty acid desaturase [Actinomycetia bacterium]|nr:fatty acid desaturase [Actinomycetes bacterium]